MLVQCLHSNVKQNMTLCPHGNVPLQLRAPFNHLSSFQCSPSNEQAALHATALLRVMRSMLYSGRPEGCLLSLASCINVPRQGQGHHGHDFSIPLMHYKRTLRSVALSMAPMRCLMSLLYWMHCAIVHASHEQKSCGLLEELPHIWRRPAKVLPL